MLRGSRGALAKQSEKIEFPFRVYKLAVLQRFPANPLNFFLNVFENMNFKPILVLFCFALVCNHLVVNAQGGDPN